MDIVLGKLGTNIEHHSLSHLYGNGLSTVCTAVFNVCSATVECVLQNYTLQFQPGTFCYWMASCQAIHSIHILIIVPKDDQLNYCN